MKTFFVTVIEHERIEDRGDVPARVTEAFHAHNHAVELAHEIGVMRGLDDQVISFSDEAGTFARAWSERYWVTIYVSLATGA